MGSQDHFYLTLPSSASMNLHSDNKISDFTTELLKGIHLNRESYEVGLTEILLDTKIENVPEKQKAFIVYRSIDYVEKVMGIEGSGGFLTKMELLGVTYYTEIFYIECGVYKSLSELALYFNMKFTESVICRDLIFYTNKLKGDTIDILELKSQADVDLRDVKSFYLHPMEWFNKGIRTTNNPHTWVKSLTSTDKAYLKMFQNHLPTVDNYLAVGEVNTKDAIRFMLDTDELLRGPGLAYIYSDLPEFQCIGDTKAQLLRVVDFEENAKVISFNHVHYLTLGKDRIDSIRIYTRDVTGKSYPFTQGTAVFKLHIRRKRFH